LTERARRWRPDSPVNVVATLSVHGRGGYDPAQRFVAGSVWRTCRTPEGPATLRVTPSDGEVEATAWGSGAPWLLDRVPAWLGEHDRPDELKPVHAVVEHAAKRNRGLRIGRTGLIFEALVPVILEQKVAGLEAWRSWQALLRRHGEPAPGPAPDGLRVLPAPDVLRRLPSWEWHRLGVGPDRSRTIVRSAQVAASLERLADRPAAEAMAGLWSVPGIGRWTAAEVVQRSHGDPDAVSVGDHNLPAVVAYALAGERTADDARMLELLEPYRGQRHRVCLLLSRSGPRVPRRGPRHALRDYRAM
jgi:3-methyladenine DNA glycosylase/8-oxoguanine DNA glycosylase